MPAVYVSSTFKDLHEHRRVAINTLDRLGYSTRAMESYFASDERPLDLCLADVARCDLYIGIFARRYGTIPAEGNPEHRSITECEFREAVRLGIPCLLFLSDESDRWPVDGADDHLQISRLRDELAAGWTCAYFDTPERLGLEISVAVAGWQRKPDFGRYLQALVAEFADLPELPGHERNLAIGDIIAIAVSLPNAAQDGQRVIVELSHAVALHRALLLVGEGGIGKSTALRFLTYHHARSRLEGRASRAALEATLIPLYVQLRGQASIREQLWAALQRPNFHCSRELFDRWLAEQPFLLLIDRLESVDVGSTIEEIAELLKYAARSRIVVASRPHPLLTGSPWLHAPLQLPSDAGLAAFFRALLGLQRGGELFDMIARHGLLDLFRRPLFARFLALSSPELLRHDRLTPAAMFEDVIERRFLTEWERPDSVQNQRAITRDFLARLAHNMIVANTDSVTAEEALLDARGAIMDRGLLADIRTLRDVVEWTLRHGLLTDVDGRLQFWHATFRDYFAALWLERHSNLLVIYCRSWNSRWHECLVYYFGMLHGQRLLRSVRILLLGIRANIATLRINPYERLATRLVFVFRCLVQAGDAGRRWHSTVLRRLPTTFSYFYLSAASTPIVYSDQHNGYDPHRYLCDLIGQMGSPECFAYLDSLQVDLNVVAPGFLHSPDDHVIERLAEALVVDQPTDPSRRSGDEVLSHLLLQSRDPRCFAALRRVACDQGPRTRAKLLGLLARTMLWHRHDSDLRQVLFVEWSALLIQITLQDDDAETREAAVTFLRELGPTPKRVPLSPPAYEAFLQGLSAEDATVRARSLAAFRIPELREHLDILWRFLGDEDIGVLFEALFHFRHSAKPQQFCRATLKVLRRHATEDVRAAASIFLEALRQRHGNADIPQRSVSLMMSSALWGKNKGITLYAVLALGTLVGDWTVPFLTHIVRGDGWDETRSAALSILIRHLGVNAADLVVEMLSDSSARMRGDAAADCYIHDFGEDFPPRVGALLFRLTTDESEYASRYATYTLQDWGYLAKDWHRYQGNPIYLGPPAPAITPPLAERRT